MGEIVGINIIKGVSVLLLVFVICFIINVQLAVASGHSSPPNMAVVFAWIGTAPAMFYSGTGFRRRFAAALLGSIASLVVPAVFAILNGALLSVGLFAYLPAVILGIGLYLTILNAGQLVVAYIIARTVARRGREKPKTSTLATA